MTPTVETFSDTDTLVNAAGDRLATAITAAIDARGIAWIVLTGGGTGIALLKRLGTHPVDWSRAHLFWGDHVDIPAANTHPMAPSDGEFGADIAAAAAAYAGMLASLAENGSPTPVFDVHLLGMGGEGHINSLFPDTDAVRETERMVIGVTDSPKPPPRRITLTLPAVRRSREVWLVVSGEAKADAVAAGVEGVNPVEVPAAGAVGTERTVWLLDTAAAARLP